MFSCTWVAIYPNIPPRRIRCSRWKMLWQRLLLMLWTVLVPMWAAHQWLDANQIVRARAAGLDATGTRDMAQRQEVGEPYDGNECGDCSIVRL